MNYKLKFSALSIALFSVVLVAKSPSVDMISVIFCAFGLGGLVVVEITDYLSGGSDD